MEIIQTQMAQLLKSHEQEILEEWICYQASAITSRPDLIHEIDLRQESRELLHLFIEAAQQNGADTNATEWKPVRDMLAAASRTRTTHGFSPSETATFVFSLKQPIFDMLRRETSDVEKLSREIWSATTLLDSLGLYTAEVYKLSREAMVGRQQQELLELSTPVVQLGEKIVALPLIGALDSARTQVMMENLLEKIVQTGALIAIIDISGVPTVDTLVAQHLLQTVAAARLMGTDCIISGIRPQIAQTIVHLGINLTKVITKATLADAFAVALQRTGLTVAQ